MGDVMVGSCLEHNNYEMIGFLIFGKVRKVVSRTAALDFQKAAFGLFRNLSWEWF